MARKSIQEKAKATTEQVTKVIEEVAYKFTKKQLLKSDKYVNRQDALNALLKDDKTYTLTEVDEILKQFYKGGNE